MAFVKPFRAWHYDSRKTDLARVIAPPYDVISDSYGEELRRRSPYNVIRLILGQPKAGGAFPDRQYAQAQEFFRDWIEKGILVWEPADGCYLYEINFPHPFLKKRLTRLALFSLLKLEPFERKVVFPHERTHAAPKVDRGKLLRATCANFSPVFALYEDPTSTLDQIRERCGSQAPLFDFQDSDDARHTLWVIRDSKEMEAIGSQLDRKRMFLADGHHRYETALQYAQEIARERPSDEGQSWNYVMTAFVRFHDPGLLILPIHRVILGPLPLEKDQFLSGLKKYFVLHSVAREVLEKISEGSLSDGFGLALSEGECYLLELKDQTRMRHAMPGGKSQAWYGLALNQITCLVFKPLLGLDEPLLETGVFYTSSHEETFGKLRSGEGSCAFLMRPVTPGTIKEVSESGELMPQKSTYFYPKFPSGLLIYRH